MEWLSIWGLTESLGISVVRDDSKIADISFILKELMNPKTLTPE